MISTHSNLGPIGTLYALAIVWLTFSASCELQSQEPAAASVAFTTQDEVVLDALKLVRSGNFASAEELLSQKDPEVEAEARQARLELVDILRRIRFEYSLDAAGLLAKVKKSVSDATGEEVERWAIDSRARFRMIDGKKYYFRREPQNIFLFCKEAIDRRSRMGGAPPPANWRLTDHLTDVLAASERSGSAEVLPVKHRFTHTITIRGDHPKIKRGSTVRVWMPFAQEYRQQREVKLVYASPEPKLLAPTAIDGDPITGAPQRTLYFEVVVEDPAKPLVFQEVFEYTSFAYCPKLDAALVESLPNDWGDRCLTERRPHIAFTPEIRNEVASIVGDDDNPLLKAQRIFRWVSANIPWNAEDEYCTIPSFAIKAYTDRRGDCGVQNTLFITMCRIAGIPARWQSGFETKPGQWGMHDWAEIYIAPWGWLPADASYGVQKSDDPRVADFYCGHQDSYRLIVNLDWGHDLFPTKRSLRSEPADFQRGEVEVDGQNLYFDEWESKSEVVR